MMNIRILKTCRNLFRSFLSYLKENYLLAKIESQNPTCKFYKKTILHNSKFGSFNVIFQRTNVIESVLGSHTYIQKDTVVINAEIGKYCSIASGVTIGPGMHEIEGISTHPSFYLKNTPLMKTYSNKDLLQVSKRTYIGNDVWIGQNVIIMDGIKIGNGAIIAAGAVVTKNVAPYSIVGGVPAKHIKYRFDEGMRSLLEKSEWWNYPEIWFEKNWKLMGSIEKFITYIK